MINTGECLARITNWALEKKPKKLQAAAAAIMSSGKLEAPESKTLPNLQD